MSLRARLEGVVVRVSNSGIGVSTNDFLRELSIDRRDELGIGDKQQVSLFFKSNSGISGPGGNFFMDRLDLEKGDPVKEISGPGEDSFQ